ncbi:putative arginase [Colletotrichum godetiae]|uniref:Arginase n=1 Tax=Colletotrichum godetiae TaxID=1209918 RepID=A0AAJ0A761_9PEZI|nr:putative arginase [Colletotrichum godetiae]KAK1657786.1 putative arginase [Colletotrichum godetiae]
MSKLPLRSLSLILSPYHVGLHNKGPGAGPAFLKTSGLDSALRSLGLPLREIKVEPVDDHEGEIGRSFEVIKRTAKLVAQERRRGSFPIVLAGNCSSAVGVAAGLHASQGVGKGGLGCVWFDAHDDFNTPDTVMSGYFDSMPIAMLAGQCWKGLLGTVPGHQPMNLERLVHVGMRDVNDLERARVAEAGFDVIWGSTEKKVDFGAELGVVLQRKNLGSTMVHFDVDSLDTSIGHANRFAAPGGLLREDIIGCFGAISEKAEPVSLTVASFDPSYEGAGNLASVAVEAIKLFLESLVKSGVLAKP